jgi:glycosyltransferase involved in cell wall biosynthesis
VGTTSNMLHYEGLDLLILALAKAQQAGVPVHGLFVGGGPCAAALRQQAEALGVPATFVGRVPAAQVPGWLRRMDLFVVPRRDLTITRFAGPIKLVEAMAAGLPIVGSRIGDIEPLLTNGRGLLIKAGWVEALAEAVIELAGQPDRRAALGRLAREYALSHLRWSSAADRHREAYARALAGG